jgi:protein TonB
MPRDLFGDVTRPSISIGSRKWYTLPVSLLSHSVALGLLIAVPILAPSMLPEIWSGEVVAYMTVLPPPPPPPPPVIRHEMTEQPPASPTAAFPTDAPTGFTKERELPVFETDKPIDGFVIGEVKDGPVEPIVPKPAPVEPVRVGGTIRTPQKVHDVAPVYSPVAIAARIEGIVILEATIGIDGQVVNARVLRSVPFLDQAALDAVRQWQFTPTLLNGVPVPVLMTVTVRFTLK